jgi:Fic family protein
MEPYVPHNLPLSNIDWATHVTDIGRANASLARYDGILQGIVNYDLLLTPLTTREAVLSSRIEGTRASFEDVMQFEAKGGEPVKPAMEADIQEILNYRAAMHEAVVALQTRPISINMIRDLHRTLLTSVRGRDKEPGEIRRIQNYIGKRGDPIEKAIFVPPSPEFVMDALSNWEAYLHRDERDPLVQLAILKAQFELIHPFRDGNGRIGRMLVPLILHSKKMISRPMFYISAYLEENRDLYYERLRALSREDDWNGWITFFLRAITFQADENCQSAQAILTLYNAMKQEVPKVTRVYSIQATDALFFRPIFSATDFSEYAGIPTRTSQRILSDLTECGIISLRQESRGRQPATYNFPALITIIEGKVGVRLL